MNRTREEILAARAAVRARFGALFDTVEAILFRHDPIGIAFFDDDGAPLNPDEYAPEVETILPRLADAQTVQDLAAIVHEEMVRWFDEEEAGEVTDYAEIAEEIWSIMTPER